MLRFRPCDRVKKPQEFQRAFDHGRAVRTGAIVVRVVANGLDYDRLGLAVSRRYGTAVRRSRFRRLVREAFRLTRPAWPAPPSGGGLDLVAGPASGAEPDLAAVQKALTQAVVQGRSAGS